MASLFLYTYLLIICYELDTILGVGDIEKNKSLTLSAFFYPAEASSQVSGRFF